MGRRVIIGAQSYYDTPICMFTSNGRFIQLGYLLNVGTNGSHSYNITLVKYPFDRLHW